MMNKFFKSPTNIQTMLQSREFLLQLTGLTLKLQIVSLMVSIAAAQILFGFLLIFSILLYRQGARYKPTRFDIPILVFVLARLLSIIFSEYPSESFNTITKELIFYSSFYATVFYLQHATEEERNAVLRWLFISTAIVALVASGITIVGLTKRARGFTGGGTLATHLSLTMVVALCLKEEKKIFKAPLHFWLLFLSMSIGLAFTFTRGDWLATSIALLVYGSLFNKKMVLGFIVFVSVIVLSVPYARERVTTLMNPWDHSSDRLTLWKNAVTHFDEHPFFGFGPETFHHVFNDRMNIDDKGIGAWHNDVIQIYMESGLLGVSAFVFMIGSVVYVSVVTIRRTKINHSSSAVPLMGVLLVITYLVLGSFGTPTGSITNGMLFRFLLAVIAINHQERTQ
ncbi:MAG: O-antigen ligase family protein [Ignavibacteriae bacterium]|nr:O-antigen ligase family protein [Ignavibacteriota bacterium]